MISIFIKIAVIATVVAVATTGIIVGVIVGVVPTTTENVCATLRAPTDLRIVPVAQFLTVSWANSTDDCAEYYRVVVEVDGVEEIVRTEVPFHYFEHTTYCTEVNISVTRVGENGTESPSVYQLYTRDVPKDTEIVTTIDVSVESEKVRASWEPLDIFQHCKVDYKLQINDNPEFTPPNNNYHIFDDDDLEYCKEILLTLTPSIGETPHQAVTGSHTPKVPAGSEVVDRISFSVEDDGKLKAEWNPLETFTHCTFTYKLQINDEEFTPTNNYHIFADDDLEYCRELVLALTPSIGETSHQVVTGSHTPEVPALSAVVGGISFRVAEDGKLRAEWNILAPFTQCTFAYKLLINEEEFTPTNNYHIFADDDLEYCKELVLALTPSIGDTSHQVVTGSHTPEVPALSAVVGGISFRVAEDEKLRAEWNTLAPFTHCTFAYKLLINGEEFTPTNNYHSFADDDLEYCRELVLALTPSIGETSHQVVTGSHTPEVPALSAVVGGISFRVAEDEKLRAEWNILAPFTHCTFAYKLLINGEEFTPTNNYHSFADDDLEYCRELVLALTPSIGETSHQVVTGSHTPEVPALSAVVGGISFRVAEDEKLRAEWNILAPFTHCTFAYKLLINGEEFTPTNNYHSFADDDLEYCRELVLALTPSIGETSHQVVTGSHTPEVPALSAVVGGISFRVAEDEKLRAEWNILAPFTHCTFAYKLLINGEEFTPTNNYHSFADDDLEYCRELVLALTPSIGETSHQVVTGSHTPEVPALSAVVGGISFRVAEDEKLRAEWNILAPFTHCTFAYKLLINGEEFTPTNNYHSFADDDLEYCRELVLALTPSIGETSHQVVTGSHTPEVPALSAVVGGISFRVAEDEKLRAEWNILAPFTHCTFAYKLLINGEEFTPTNNYHSFADDDLEYCRELVLALTPSIGETSHQVVTGSHTPEVPALSAVVGGISFRVAEDEKLRAEWNILAPFTHCTFAYKLLINGEEFTPTNNYHSFADDDLEYCRELVLALTPSIGETSHQVVTGSHTPEVPALSAVVGGISFRVAEDEKLRAEWNILAPFTHCTFAYKLLINGEEFTPTNNYHSFADDDWEYCRELVLALTPSIGETSHQVVTGSHTPEVPALSAVVGGISFRVAEDEKLRAEWNILAPFTHCTFAYKLLINGEEFTPTNNYHSFADDDLEYCRELVLALTPSIGETSHQVVTGSHTPEVPALSAVVGGISFRVAEDEKLRAEWNILAPFTHCTFAYKLLINGEEFTPTNNYHSFADDDLEYCRELVLALTPSIGETSHQVVTGSHTPEVPALSAVVGGISFRVAEDEKLRAEWNILAPFTHCTFAYKLLINGEEFTPTNNYHSFADDDWEYCRELVLALTPSIGESSHQVVTGSHTPEVPALSAVLGGISFRVAEDEKLRAEWNILAPFTHCTFAYKLLINGEEFTPTNNYHSFADDDLEYCRELVLALTPSIGETSHQVVTGSHTPEVPALSAVVDGISFRVAEDEKLRAEWNILAPFTHCTFAYKLLINGEEFTPTNNYHSFADDDLEYCRELVLALTPSIGETSHQVVTGSHIPVIPDDFGTNFDPHRFDLVSSQLQMTWELKDKGACDIVYSGYCVLDPEEPGSPTVIGSPHTFVSCEVNDNFRHEFTVSIQPLLNVEEGDVPDGTDPNRPETVCRVLIDEGEIVGDPFCAPSDPDPPSEVQR